MKIIKVSEDSFILRLEIGEEIKESIFTFLLKVKFKSGFFYGIGAVNKISVGYYDENKKDYKFFKFKGQFEILSLIGNIFYKQKHPFVHSHIVLSKKDGSLFGGHLEYGYVYPTCEIFFNGFKTKIKRHYDKLTNLYLIDEK